ncbi:FecR family protein [Chitinophaga costaii]|uniref:FecR family protein n=2 Tax=Chitinophaga costaii TaxID=1335309 RepID=A0A1C4FTZ0_9BACT|nr:FecR family protein [Chitinophaga costaii]
MGMLPQNIKAILEKIGRGEATAKEIALLNRFISENFSDAGVENAFESYYTTADDILIKERLDLIMNSGKPVQRKIPVVLPRVIAVLFFLTGIILCARYFRGAREKPIYAVDIRTLEKEKKSIMLPDSSFVWLNESSHIQYRSNPQINRREVLLEGEATFEVKHNDRVPFAVITGRLSTVDVGTRFNVYAYKKAEQIRIDVMEGSVYVSDGDQKISANHNESVFYLRKSALLQKKKVLLPHDPDWHSLSFDYKDIAMHDLVAQLQRYYQIQLIIPSKISTCHVYACLGETSIEQSLKLIAESLNGQLLRHNENTFEIRGGTCR